MNKLLFKSNKAQMPFLGTLIYRQSEYSLDFIEYSDEDLVNRIGDNGCTSLTVNTLQFEVSIDTGKLLYPWGLFPITHAIQKQLNLPKSYYGDVSINVDEKKLIRGVSIDFPNSEHWELYKDPYNGWFFIGDLNITQYSCSIEFATNVIVSIKNNDIVAFWMNPHSIY